MSEEVQKTFNKTGNTNPSQALTLSEQYDCAPTTRGRMQVFLRDVLKHTSLNEAYMGPNKELETAEGKINRRFGGDAQFLTDVVRGKVVIDDSDQLGEILAILNDPDSDIMKKHGIEVAHVNDNFETPKQYTWYRGLGYKLSVPTDTGKPQIIELQVVSEAMEKVYDITHPHKRAAEEIYNLAATEERELTDDELELVTQHYAVCQYYNSKVAHEEGFDRYLKDPEKYAFNDVREEKLLNKMAQIGVEPS